MSVVFFPKIIILAFWNKYFRFTYQYHVFVILTLAKMTNYVVIECHFLKASNWTEFFST